jgi:hypothetical protein
MTIPGSKISDSDVFVAIVTKNYLRDLADKTPECLHAQSLGKPIILLVQREVGDRAELEALRMLLQDSQVIWWDLDIRKAFPELQRIILRVRASGRT